MGNKNPLPNKGHVIILLLWKTPEKYQENCMETTEQSTKSKLINQT